MSAISLDQLLASRDNRRNRQRYLLMPKDNSPARNGMKGKTRIWNYALMK